MYFRAVRWQTAGGEKSRSVMRTWSSRFWSYQGLTETLSGVNKLELRWVLESSWLKAWRWIRQIPICAISSRYFKHEHTENELGGCDGGFTWGNTYRQKWSRAECSRRYKLCAMRELQDRLAAEIASTLKVHCSNFVVSCYCRTGHVMSCHATVVDLTMSNITATQQNVKCDNLTWRDNAKLSNQMRCDESIFVYWNRCTTTLLTWFRSVMLLSIKVHHYRKTRPTGPARMDISYHYRFIVNELCAVLQTPMQCHSKPCHAMPCHSKPCHAIPMHTMPCHAMPCHVMSCQVRSCHVMSCHVTSRHEIWCNLTMSNITQRNETWRAIT